MKLFNQKTIVSCEITEEHVSERYYIRREQIVTKYFGLVAEHLDRAVIDRHYIMYGSTKVQSPREFSQSNSDRYDIVGDAIWCKAEVRLQFVDGQYAKYYFSKFKDALDWAKTLNTEVPITNWLQR
jgi:hypothetical protein